MFDFHEKRKMRTVFYSKPFIAFVFFVALFMLWSTYGRYVVERDTSQKLQDRENALSALKERAAALNSKVDHLENERGIEEELRNRFDVAKEGEKVVVILDDTKGGTSSATTTLYQQQSPRSHSWYDVLKFW